MKRKKSFNIQKYNVTAIWLISFSIVILCSVIINVLTYYGIDKNYSESIKQYSNAIIESKISITEGYVNNIVSGAINIAGLIDKEDLQVMEEAEYPFSGLERYNISKISEKIRNTSVSESGTASTFLYLPNSDVIVGTDMVKKSKDFFNIMRYKGEYEKWFENILNSDYNGFYNDRENGLIFYVFNPMFKSAYSPVILISVNKNEIIDKIGTELNGDFVIFKSDGSQLLSTTGENYVELAADLDFSSKLKGTRLKDYVITYKNQGNFGWSYAYIVKTNEYRMEMRKSRYIMLFGVALCLLIGIALSMFFSRRNNRSVVKLAKKLGKGLDAADKNEYFYIENAVNEMMEQNVKNDTALYRQNKVLAMRMLERVLCGEPVTEDMSEKLSSFGISFENKYFLTIMIEPCEYENIFFEKNEDLQQARRIARLIVSNIYEELLNEEFVSYVVENSPFVTCIINAEENSFEVKERIKKVAERASVLITEKFNFELAIGVSGFHETESGICECYNESQKAMEYKLICSDEQLLDYEKLNKNATTSYYYPFEKEQIIINNIKKGDYETSRKIIDEILEINIGKQLSLEMTKCLIFDILSTFIKTANDVFIDNDEGMLCSNNFYERIVSCNTIEAVKIELFRILEMVCENVSRNKQGARARLIEKIKDYVDDNYTDKMLNVSAVAEKFDVTVSFLSALFKQIEGIGLLEYISRKRVSEAKRLIENTNIPIDKIADQTGFTSKRTFFRAFTKYQGMPPGKFRE